MTACPTCGGDGVRSFENWHENEVQDCPDCGGTGQREEITAAEFKAMQEKQVTRKYRNEPVEEDGHRFDSKAERRRYRELKLMQDAGEIESLRLQHRIDLVVSGTFVCAYVSDFSYWDTEQKTWIYEDVKGVRTAAYRIKKKLLKALSGIDITEIPA